MTTKTPTACPHCERDLAANQRGKHCPSPNCTWLKCSCGSVNAGNGNHIHEKHKPGDKCNPIRNTEKD